MNEERRHELLGHTHLGRHVLGGLALFFDEAKINRASDGKFATKGGAGGKSADAASESEIDSGGSRFVSGKSGGRFVSSSPRGSGGSNISEAVASLGSKVGKAVKSAGHGLAKAIDFALSRNDDSYKELEKEFGHTTANLIVASGMATSMGAWTLAAALPVAASLHMPLLSAAKMMVAKDPLTMFGLAAGMTAAGKGFAPGLERVTRYPGKIAARLAVHAVDGIKRAQSSFGHLDNWKEAEQKRNETLKNLHDAAKKEGRSADFADGDEKTLSEERIKELGKEYAKKKAADLMKHLLANPDACKKMAQAMIDEGQCTAEELREFAEKILAKAKS